MPTDPTAILNGILDLVATRGLSSLTPHERRIYLVNRLLFELDRGGLSGFLYNCAPGLDAPWTLLTETVAAVSSLGRAEVAEYLDQARLIVEADSVSGSTWEEFLAQCDATGRLRELDRLLSEASEALFSDLIAAAGTLPDHGPGSDSAA